MVLAVNHEANQHENQNQHEDLSTAANDKLHRRRKAETATKLNNMGKVVFPIILIVFTTLYFILSVSAFRTFYAN